MERDELGDSAKYAKITSKQSWIWTRFRSIRPITAYGRSMNPSELRSLIWMPCICPKRKSGNTGKFCLSIGLFHDFQVLQKAFLHILPVFL